MMRTDYVCCDSEDKVTKGCLAKGYFQDGDKGLSCEGYFQDKDKGVRLRLELRYI